MHHGGQLQPGLGVGVLHDGHAVGCGMALLGRVAIGKRAHVIKSNKQ